MLKDVKQQIIDYYKKMIDGEKKISCNDFMVHILDCFEKAEKQEETKVQTLPDDLEQQISEMIMNHFNYIYCNNCKFANINEETSEKLYNYYGCDDCHRKNMGWEVSKEYSDKVSKQIMSLITPDKKIPQKRKNKD